MHRERRRKGGRGWNARTNERANELSERARATRGAPMGRTILQERERERKGGREGERERGRERERERECISRWKCYICKRARSGRRILDRRTRYKVQFKKSHNISVTFRINGASCTSKGQAKSSKVEGASEKGK